MEEMFKALGDPTRLRILRMLAESGEMCVCEIVNILEMGQPAVSHHMALLRRVGLVNHRKCGQWTYYSIRVDAIVEGPLAHLNDVVDMAIPKAGITRDDRR